jgi:uncharacterized protein
MAGKTLADLKLNHKLRAALRAIRDRVSTQFDIDRVILFGSVAWGHPDEESDVDVLFVLKDNIDLETENRISHEIFEINLEYDTNLSELIVDRQTWDSGLASAMPIRDQIERRGVRV